MCSGGGTHRVVIGRRTARSGGPQHGVGHRLLVPVQLYGCGLLNWAAGDRGLGLGVGELIAQCAWASQCIGCYAILVR